jgi:phage terminase large subunit-like protein
VKLDDLSRQVDEAQEMPGRQNAIRRLRLNEWTEQVTRWLDMAVWDCGGPPGEMSCREVRADLDELEERLARRKCFGGLDLARVNDLSAFVLLFPSVDDATLGAIGQRWIVLARFWVPEENILRRSRRDRVPV